MEPRRWGWCVLLGMMLLGACGNNESEGQKGQKIEQDMKEQENQRLFEEAQAAWREGRSQEGADLMQRAAQQGDVRAMEAWAQILLNGAPGIPGNAGEGVTWLHKAADAGSSAALAALGDCADRGVGMKKDPRQAVTYYRQGAEAGSVRAQVMLGLAYRDGYGGLPKDFELSYRWMLRAAEKGSADACYYLAECYDAGLGVKADQAVALTHALRAADMGQPMACVFMGKASLRSYGGQARDDARAAAYFRRAAAAGVPEALCLLGKLYAGGNGVEKDLKKAADYFEQAAKKGDLQGRRIRKTV